MSGARLPRAWRLVRAGDLRVVQREGRRRRTPRLDIRWRPNDLGHPRLGLVVPRFGESAVARNRLRRRLREAARRRVLPFMAPFDIVVRSKPLAYRANFQELTADLEGWARTLSE